MFIYDKPIESEDDDFLGRKNFSQHLGKALLDWNEKESLVIAVYGEWGAGKSSVISLASRYIGRSEQKNKPTIIEFNPWSFSEEDNLGGHFFNELAKELEIKKDTEKDKSVAKKLKLYASLLSLAPEKNLLNNLYSKVLILLGLLGITSSQVIDWFKISANWIQLTLLIGGFLLLLVELFKGALIKFAKYFDNKVDCYSKPISELKRVIKRELAERNKKLVIVIDDIDRLTQSEIRKIFRIIRINADFPNTIYLLAFDREIIEKNLEEQEGISGKDYLNKIIQVSFDLLFAKPTKIYTFLLEELDRIVNVLPEAAKIYFDQNDPYWLNVFNSGFKDFFKNVRDVKRYANSLRFNIGQMYQGEVMEVNPIDFIAIEAIRLFIPKFYSFMKAEKSLFTDSDYSRGDDGETRKKRKENLERGFELIDGEYKDAIKGLVFRLFPQVSGICSRYGNTYYGSEWQSTWSQSLRVCANNNFDSYFTLFPGGDEEELSQYEIEEILSRTDSEEEFEKIVRTYIEKGKIRKVLQRFQDFTNDQQRIAQKNFPNIIKTLFNISDDLPKEKLGMLDFGVDIDSMRIIYQLLKQIDDKDVSFVLLRDTIKSSKGLFGPIQKISFESPGKENSKDPNELLISEGRIEELQNLCVEKILDFGSDQLFKHSEFPYILYRWKEWDKQERWRDFIKDIIADNVKTIFFISKFITEIKSQTIGDYGVSRNKKLNYESLSDLLICM